MDVWTIIGAVGVGLVAAGVVGIIGRRKRQRLAAAGDEKAKADLVKWRTRETVIAPSLLVAGICLLAVKFHADYEKARTPLSSEKALEKAIKSLMDRLPK